MKTWPVEYKNDVARKVILFLINPILGALYSLKRMNTKSSYIIFFCYMALFGLSMTMESSFYQNDATNAFLDSMHHRADFEIITRMSWAEFTNSIFVSWEDYERKDYYDYILKFLVGRVTDNYHVFFMTVAMIFAFFALKSFRYFTNEDNFSNTYPVYLLAYIFMLMQIIQINGVRFYTAAWIAVFALFKVFLDNKKKYILLLLLLPLIHRSFIFLYVILFLVYFTKEYKKLWITLFFTSIIFSEVASVLLASNIDILPDSFSGWATGYLESNEKFGDAGRFYSFFSLLTRLFRILLMYIIIKRYKEVLSNAKTSEIFKFLLILFTISNFSYSVSNLGSRFSMLTCPFLAYIWLVLFKDRYKYILYLIPFIYFYKALYYDPGLYMQLLEPCFIYSSPLFLIFKYLIAF